MIFDPRANKVSKDTFYSTVDLKTQKGRTEGKSTLEWWDKQSPHARKALKGTAQLPDVLEDLAFWLPTDCRIWGNGPNFDMWFLEDAYRWADMEVPWMFWNIRDCRTIKDLYESRRGGYGVVTKEPSHNSREDAIRQAKDICKMWKELLKS